MSEIIDASFFSEYSPKFSPTDVFSSPRLNGSSCRKPLAGSSSSGIAMSADNSNKLDSNGLRKSAESPERSSPLDVLATVSAEKADKPKQDEGTMIEGGEASSSGGGTNIGSEMDSGLNVSTGELDLGSPVGQSNDLSMDVHSNDGKNSLHNLSLSALEPLGMDDSRIDTQSDTDSPLLGARLNEYSIDRTGQDTSSICLSSSLADINTNVNAHAPNGGMMSRSQQTATKRKLQNMSGNDATLNMRYIKCIHSAFTIIPSYLRCTKIC